MSRGNAISSSSLPQTFTFPTDVFISAARAPKPRWVRVRGMPLATTFLREMRRCNCQLWKKSWAGQLRAADPFEAPPTRRGRQLAGFALIAVVVVVVIAALVVNVLFLFFDRVRGLGDFGLLHEQVEDLGFAQLGPQ